MRTVRVVTNETCNQNCVFCVHRRSKERREVLREVRSSLVSANADEVVLTGGEPTLRSDLSGLAALASGRVVLETNAVLLDRSRGQALREAGVDVLRIHLPAWGEDYARIVRVPGAFEQLLRALGQLRDLGFAFEASLPLCQETAEALPKVLEALHGGALGLRWSALWLRWLEQAPTDASLLSPKQAADAALRLAAMAKRWNLPLRWAPDGALPPCVFDAPGRVAHLYSLTKGGAERRGHRRDALCQECAVADRCPGLKPNLAAVPRRPVAPSQRRRLSLIRGVPEQIRRELWQDDLFREGGVVHPARIVRLRFACNQRCEFCFVSTHLPAPERVQVEAAIVEAAEQEKIVVLSGGEPTLAEELPELVSLAKAHGAPHVDLQTNATRLADAAYCQTLEDAGVDWLFVSLHGPRAEISDAVTGAPGTFEQTVRGIDTAAAFAFRLRLNFVFCQQNAAHFEEHVAYVARRWPGATLVVSFVAPSTDMVPKSKALIPRYGDILPSLRAGLALAEQVGLQVTGFDSMCGLPLCLLPEDVRHQAAFTGLADLDDAFAQGEMVRGPQCSDCTLREKCFGLRRGYAELYGTDELRSVAASPS